MAGKFLSKSAPTDRLLKLDYGKVKEFSHDKFSSWLKTNTFLVRSQDDQ